ncbi:MAG TPA: GAF domain-containing protein [Steroidobacteraceae bacterium]|jgi:putative methionine-R-sulfoxide reductase with GAF domain|nr:GAF domain-containing protein [Steroidobacteraceae bacterium]
MSAQFEDGLSLFAVRRMMEGVVPPSLCTASAEHVPNVSYLSLAEYVDPQHVALSYQFFNRSRDNVLATRRASLTLDDPYTGAGVVLQLEYQRTETEGPVFERLRAKLMGVASHVGMANVFHLRGADIYRVLELRRVPGRKELPAAQPRVDLPTNSRLLSERMAHCEELADLLDTLLDGLQELLRIDHAMLWLFDSSRAALTLLASRGYETDGAGAEISIGEGIVGTAVREGVPIRVGHMMNMATYARAVRDRADALGLEPVFKGAIPLPGLEEPRSQLAVPLRARGRVLGALLAESGHDQYFGYDDEDALMMLCGQFAVAMSLMQPAEPEPPPREPPRAVDPTGGPAVRLRRYARDNSIFLDEVYLIRGVAGAILWKLAGEFLRSGRREFSNRELRLSPDLRLPDVQDNLEVRLLLLQRRLAEQRATIQLEKAGRGRMRLSVSRPIVMESD